MKRVYAFLALMAVLSAPLAKGSDIAGKNDIQALAAHKQWHHLLHVRYHPYTFRTLSQNDSPAFFLSEQGKVDPAAELQADLEAFLQTEQAPDSSAQCRFPARYHWLKQQLPDAGFIDQPCPEFEEWRQDLAAHRLTLIFPASHINSPSSMYGHTLVRLDRKDPESSKLLAYSVNFAADADPEDNELKFSWKGLTGGYPGTVSVMPYYVKTNEYQYMEYRDVWEYQLSFTQEEVDQFVRHIWETRDTHFDYFFFDENCSYRLMALLDAASERADLADRFVRKAVPVDTIRALKDEQFLYQIDFRPSAATLMENMADHASVEEQAAAHLLVETDLPIDDILSGMTVGEQRRSLELAQAYARYLSVKKKQANPVLRQRTIDILSTRSRLPSGAAFPAPDKPPVRDDEGHGSSRLMLSANRIDGLWRADARWRIAYHDIMDVPSGFVPGAQIQMGEFDLGYLEGEGVQLNSLTVVDVLSLSHMTDFQSPVAWGVSGGLDRFQAPGSELFGYLNIGFGRAWHTRVPGPEDRPTGDGRLFVLGQVTARADNQFRDGYQLTAGPRVGWLWQGALTQELISFTWEPLTAGDDHIRRALLIEEGFTGASDDQLRLGFEREWLGSQATNRWHLSYAWYF